ncbi:MAG: DNA translocase FtsK 4TM domain-containing protein [Hyphomicrobiaceae bacterium]
MAFESAGRSAKLLPDAVEDQLKGWSARLIGAGLVVLAVCGWLALLTWSVTDPSLSNATGRAARNLLGPIGAISSDILLQCFGLGAVLLFLPLASWGIALAARECVARLRLKLALLPVAVIAISGAFSSLPTAGTWPLQHGFGGIFGDIAYGLVSNILPGLGYGRAGTLAGALLFAAGIVALITSLGLTRREIALLWQTQPRQPRAPSHGRQRDPELVAPRAFGPMTAGARPQSPPRGSGERPVDGADEQSPVRPPGGRDTDFDDATDSSSRSIAERFAPDNVSGGAEESRAVPPAGKKPGGLLSGWSARGSAEPTFRLPSLQLLKRPSAAKPGPEFTQAVQRGNARLLEDVLADFGIKGEVRNVRPGPVVTLYEVEPARGIKAARVIALADDIARSMSAHSARIAVVPGRNVIGIELPNVRREPVYLREILEHEAFKASDAQLPLALGKAINGDCVVTDLARMPHLLIAGTTGSGKSVGVNSMILSLLYRLTPAQCRFIMIDPKMLELSVYNGIPHLLAPVVIEPQKAVAALDWVVREMEERYKRMASLGVRSLEFFNARVRNAQRQGETLRRTVQTGFDRASGEAVYETEELDLSPLPHIVVVVDEFADLMIVAGKEIEGNIQRLAQMARAAGIHLIMATQRPSVDVITGTIKANFPSRISFRVASKIDSRTILNEQGAEQLLGQGDMLMSAGGGQLVRVHGPFVSDEEVEQIAAHLRTQGEPNYVEGITELREDGDDVEPVAGGPGSGDLYERALAIVLRDRKASTSYLQRRLSIGYNRAADLIERMEREGIVSPASPTGKRTILDGGEPN